MTVEGGVTDDEVVAFFRHLGLDPDILSHHGVKGQKWGVRKEESPTGSIQSASGKGWTIASDGSIEISRGATISRVVRNTKGLLGGEGASLDSGKPIYAAFKPIDAATYENMLGRRKSLLVKNASNVLQLTPKSKLRSPGPKESMGLYFDTLRSDPKVAGQVRESISPMLRARFDKALSGKGNKGEDYFVYSTAYDSGNYKESLSGVNKAYHDRVKSKGFNMIVDPSDASLGVADAPIIILDGRSVELKSQYFVDKASSMRAKDAFNTEAAKAGKTYLEKLGYV
jgi:hypothetical protein